MNLEKHVKRPLEQWMLADENPLSTHARSPRIVGRYIKDRKLKYPAKRTAGAAPPAPLIVRLIGLWDGLSSRDRIETWVRDLNHRLHATHRPFRIRLMSS